jgi:hypothetical protein
MRASLIKLTIGDYLYRVPGFLESVNVTIAQDSTWEIDDGSQLPHYVDVAISFKPILAQLPQRNTTTNAVTKIIRQDESVGMVAASTNSPLATDTTSTTSNTAAASTNANASTNQDNFIGPVIPPEFSSSENKVDNLAKKQAEVKKKTQTTQNKKKTSAKPATKSSSTPAPTVAKPVGPVANPTPPGIPPGLFGYPIAIKK